jgi:hypothetical protein
MSKVNLDDKIAQMRQDVLTNIEKGIFVSPKPVAQKVIPEIKARYILRITGDQYGRFVRCKRSDCCIDISVCSECGIFKGEYDKNIYCDFNDDEMKLVLDEDDIQ